MNIALLDSNDDVIATGADNYTVSSFNTAYPSNQYAADSKVTGAPTGLKVKVTDDNILPALEVRSYHRKTGDTGLSIDDYTLIEDLRAIKQYRRDQVNTKTDELIALGFTWEGVKFRLDLEHQMSYKAAHDIRDELTYPYTIKGEGESFYQITDAAEYHTFLLAAFTYKETQIQTGWSYKTQLESLTAQQLLDWSDPRS